MYHSNQLEVKSFVKETTQDILQHSQQQAYFAKIEKAKKVVNAFIDATERGLGVVSLGTKMIDPPVVKRAETTINLAISLGLISEDWREEFLNKEL